MQCYVKAFIALFAIAVVLLLVFLVNFPVTIFYLIFTAKVFFVNIYLRLIFYYGITIQTGITCNKIPF